MTGEFGEAFGAIAGIAFGGFILLMLASELNSITPINLAAWGVLYLVAALVLTVVLIVGAIRMLMR